MGPPVSSHGLEEANVYCVSEFLCATSFVLLVQIYKFFDDFLFMSVPP